MRSAYLDDLERGSDRRLVSAEELDALLEIRLRLQASTEGIEKSRRKAKKGRGGGAGRTAGGREGRTGGRATPDQGKENGSKGGRALRAHVDSLDAQIVAERDDGLCLGGRE